MHLTMTKIASLSDAASVAPPLSPTQRADLAAIRQSMRALREEAEKWMHVSDFLYRALKELRGNPWLKVEMRTMSLPVDSDMLDSMLESVDKALSQYESAMLSKS